MKTERWLLLVLIGLFASPSAWAVDPDLVAWWKLDDGEGTVVLDSSPYESHGTLNGDLAWVAEGRLNGAMSFPGGSGSNVVAPCAVEVLNRGDVTYSVWFTTNLVSTPDLKMLQQADNPGTGRNIIYLAAGDLSTYLGNGRKSTGAFLAEPETWYHAAVVITEQGDFDTVAFFINGESIGATYEIATEDCGGDYMIGSAKNGNKVWNGLLDDLRIYKRALTAEEITEVMVGAGVNQPKASTPNPANGQLYTSTDGSLSWRAGDFAVTSALYFGTDADAVAQATPESEAFVIETDGTSYTSTEPLVPGTTYYWRVDSINESDPNSPWIGHVWSFTIPPLTAYAPTPVVGAEYVMPNHTLTWQPGLDALLHTVYVGTDADQVAQASGGLQQLDASYTPPIGEPGQTYYWRVDEYAPPMTHKGQVWSYTIVPTYEKTDETLVGLWTMDQVGGASVVDTSGYGNHGAVDGTLAWADGVNGSALDLDGKTLITASAAEMETNTVTMSGWFKPNKLHGRTGLIFSRDVPATGLDLWRSNQIGYHWSNINTTYQYESGLFLKMGEWSFVAMVIEPEKATFYLDGVTVMREHVFTHDPVAFSGSLYLGADPQGTARRFDGAIDDLRFYNKALSVDEIEQLSALGTVPPTVVDPMTIENFDSYNAYLEEGGEDVWNLWSDGYSGNGTASLAGNANEPFMSRTIVHAGSQALPLTYNNTGSFLTEAGDVVTTPLSELQRTFDPPLDLTSDGALGLSIAVRGNGNNLPGITDAVYMVLSDGVKSDEIALLPPESMNLTRWQEIVTPLSELTVDTTQVKEIVFGVGNRANPMVDSTGVVYFDELKLVTSLD